MQVVRYRGEWCVEWYNSSQKVTNYPRFFVDLATIRTFASTNYIKMETERVLLRPWRESDAETLFKYASDPEVGPRARWPLVSPSTTI